MKKIIVFMAMVLVLLCACQHGNDTGTNSKIDIPTFSGVGIGRSVMQDISSSDKTEEDEIIAECLYPVITGWKEVEIGVDLSEIGTSYQYKDVIFGDKNVNITIEHTSWIVPPNSTEPVDESNSIDGLYIYTGVIDAEYFGKYGAIFPVDDEGKQSAASFFQMYIWTDIEGNKKFVFIQSIGANKFAPDGTLINEYLVTSLTSVDNFELVGEINKTMVYTDVVAQAVYYAFDGTSSVGKEGAYFSGDCLTSRSEGQFSFTMRNIENTTREGDVNFAGENGLYERVGERSVWLFFWTGGNTLGYLSGLAVNDPRLDGTKLEDAPNEYINDLYIQGVSFHHNDLITEKTFTKSFN